MSLFFFEWNLTTEAMGIWRFAGAFAVAKRQSECGSKNLQNALQPPLPIGGCYGLGDYQIIFVSFRYNSSKIGSYISS